MPIQLSLDLLLMLMVVLAAGNDLLTRRIPNLLLLTCSLGAVGLHLSGPAPTTALLGAFAGAATGLAVFLPLYCLRGMAAGDVKLMAAVGAFTGPQDMPLTLLATFIAGGLMTVLLTLRRGTARRLMRNVRDMLCKAWWQLACREVPVLEPAPVSAGKMPYALAIAAGAWCQLALNGSRLAAWLQPG